jgi:hypothetical protein
MEWVSEVLPELQVWIDLRAKQGIPRAKRFNAESVNLRGYFDPVEVGRAFASGRCWYLLSILDYYDVVWHCRRCFAASDVWMRTEYRPPDACPNCGYRGPAQ